MNKSAIRQIYNNFVGDILGQILLKCWHWAIKDEIKVVCTAQTWSSLAGIMLIWLLIWQVHKQLIVLSRPSTRQRGADVVEATMIGS